MAVTVPVDRGIQWTCEPDRCTPNDCQPDCQPNCNPNCQPGCYPTTCAPVKNAAPPIATGSDCRPVGVPPLRTMWLELTGQCQLECVHCYADSSPRGTHGTMKLQDWLRVITEAAELNVRMVQLIGGEPTLYPHWTTVVSHALAFGIDVEVYSNLVRIKPEWWDLFALPGMSLATSYYSASAEAHDAITGRKSHGKTRANILEALSRGIPIRVGVIGMPDGDQEIEATMQELKDLGVKHVGLDHLRQVGRGVRNQTPSTAQLCGKCGNGKCAVAPDGSVWPCVFARWEQTTVGNVHQTSLADILAGTTAIAVNAELQEVFRARREQEEFCRPDCNPDCHPTIMCNPNCTPQCNPSCNPNCQPSCDPSKSSMVPEGNAQRDDPTFCEPDNDCSPVQDCNPKQQCDPDCNPGKHCNPDAGRPVQRTLVLRRRRLATAMTTYACAPDNDKCGPDCSPPNCQPECSPGNNGCNPNCQP